MNYSLEKSRNIENRKVNSRLIKTYMTLSKEGKKKKAYHLLEKASKKVKLVKKNDWESRSICGDFPEVDVRCLIFCCRAPKPCVLRNAVLKKMNLTVNEYAQMKKKFGQNFETKIDS